MGSLHGVLMDTIRRSPGMACALLLASCATPTAPPPAASVASEAPERVAQAPAPAPAPEPRTAAPEPAAPSTPAPPAKAAPERPAKANPAPKPLAKAVPAPNPPAKAAPEPKPIAKATPAPAPAPAAPAPLDLNSLEQRLKATSAIGVLTKLSLKNQVDDLVGRFRAYHQGERPPMLTDLRPAFDLLLMKVLALLQDHDPGLARDINASRDAIWGVLTDPRKLAQFA